MLSVQEICNLFLILALVSSICCLPVCCSFGSILLAHFPHSDSFVLPSGCEVFTVAAELHSPDRPLVRLYLLCEAHATELPVDLAINLYLFEPSRRVLVIQVLYFVSAVRCVCALGRCGAGCRVRHVAVATSWGV